MCFTDIGGEERLSGDAERASDRLRAREIGEAEVMIAHSSLAVELLGLGTACFVGPARWEWSERQEVGQRELWPLALLILALTLAQAALAIFYPEAAEVFATM